MATTVRLASRNTYPRARGSGAHRPAGNVLDLMVRDALRQLRRSCTSRPARAAQAFTDATKGRPVGTVTLARLLQEARRHGATRDAALALAHAIERFVGMLWPKEGGATLAEALEAESLAEGSANIEQLRALATRCPGAIDRALEATRRDVVAGQALLETLARIRAEVG